MRFLFALCVTLAIAVASSEAALAIPPRSIDLTADSVSYFSNRFIVTGDGNVRVRLSDGTVVRGETFAMDLKQNRFIIAGSVRLEAGGAAHPGAAFSGFADLDKSYFLTTDGTPDRWTFFGSDYANPIKGRIQPGDAFALPDLTGERPYILAHGASIIPKTNVKFVGSRVSTLGVYIPTQAFVVSFSANPNYTQNGFAGATADVGLPYNASEHAISALHLRYDPINKTYLSFDQHFAWQHDYIVASVNPLTKEIRQFNFIGYKRISPKMDFRTFFQETTIQHGIYRPDAASSFTNLQTNFALRHSSVSVNFDQYNNNLLGVTTFEQQNEHPSDGVLAWSGFDNKIAHTPIAFRLRSGIAFAHDGFHAGFQVPDGLYLENFGSTKIQTLWQTFYGMNVYTPTVKLADKTYFNAVFDKQRQNFSLPHHIDTTTTSLSISKLFLTKASALLAYSIINTGDYYGARQSDFYPAYGNITTPYGTFTSYDSFRGFATSRAVTGSLVLTPNPNFNANFTLRRSFDYPKPIPGAFGQSPYQVTGDVRVRLARQILMDISRSYYFNFADQRWSPQFSIQFGP